MELIVAPSRIFLPFSPFCVKYLFKSVLEAVMKNLFTEMLLPLFITFLFIIPQSAQDLSSLDSGLLMILLLWIAVFMQITERLVEIR